MDTGGQGNNQRIGKPFRSGRLSSEGSISNIVLQMDLSGHDRGDSVASDSILLVNDYNRAWISFAALTNSKQLLCHILGFLDQAFGLYC